MPVFFSEYFKKQLKKLKKKYPHIKEDLLSAIAPFDPKTSIHMGNSIFKLRIPSSDMNRGKSGGFRAYIYLYLKKDLLVPLCIHAKSQTGNISENELQYHFDQTAGEILKLVL